MYPSRNYRSTLDKVHELFNQLDRIVTSQEHRLSITQEDWGKRRNIVRETKYCADCLLQILSETENGRRMEYRDFFGLLVHTFTIGQHICEIVCRITIHITYRFNTRNTDLCTEITTIPDTLKKVLESMKVITSTILSTNATNYAMEKIERRCAFLKICPEFNSNVCQEMISTLIIMGRSKYRSDEEFKPLLVSVVKQFYFIEIGCGVTRVFLERDPNHERLTESESYPLSTEFKEMFKQTKSLFSHGRYTLRSLSYTEGDALEVSVVSKEIKELNGHLHSGTRFEYWNYLLKNIEALSSKICYLIDLGDKCLPEGQQQIEPDVTYTILPSSDIDDDDVENTSDCVGDLTKIPVEKVENFIDTSPMDKDEIIQVFEMEDFDSLVEICVENDSELKTEDIGGQVFDGKHWKSAKNVVVEGNRIAITTEPGKFFAVHYNFPKRKMTFNKKEMKDGAVMPTHQTNCYLRLSPMVVNRSVTVEYKIHLTDKHRIKEYQEGDPRSFGDITVFDGMQISSDVKIGRGLVEFQQDSNSPKESAYFSIETEGSRFIHWESTRVEPTFRNGKLAVDVKLDSDSTFYIIEVKNENSNRSVFKRFLDNVLTLLGFKARCKLLTLYKVPDEKDFAVNLSVFCIESKRFDKEDQAHKYLKNNWIRMEAVDESSDFIITPGDKIHLKFKGDVQPEEKQPCITFIRKGQCFVRVQVHFLHICTPIGQVLMDRNGERLDTKTLNWRSLLENWKACTTKRAETYMEALSVERGSST